MDGTQSFYLRLIYGDTNPITEVNFHYISSKTPTRIAIPETYLIEPIPVLRIDEKEPPVKNYATVRTAANGSKTKMHFGTFELRGYLDR